MTAFDGSSAVRTRPTLTPLACGAAAVALACAGLAPRAVAQQFTEIAPGLPENFEECVVPGDYDGDGDLDILVAASGKHDIAFTTLYKNTGGTFTDSGIVLTGLARATAAWGDFDGDGDLDLAMTGVPTGAVVPVTLLYRNNGATFAAVPGPFLGLFAGTVTWADYDGDGDLDLLVNGDTQASTAGVAATRLYRNDGGTFVLVPTALPDCYSGSTAWGDYDNDGDLDLVMTGASAQGTVGGIWRNDGGTFVNSGIALPSADIGFAAWGDYDNDGDLDLLFGGDLDFASNPASRIFRNDGGVFTDINAGLFPLLWSCGQWGDYDNDGDLDVMIFGYDFVSGAPHTFLYRNDGGTFVDSGLSFHGLYLGALSWMDYDGDGDLDLLTSGNTGGLDILRLYRNNNALANAVPSAPGGLSALIAGTGAMLSWSASSDDHTPAAGLTYNVRVGTTPGGSQIVSAQALSGGTRRVVALGNAQPGLTAFVDHLTQGTTYYWSVQAVDASFAGGPFAAEGSLTYAVTGVGDPRGGRAPIGLTLAPNPAPGATTIGYSLTHAAAAQLTIFDAGGHWVRAWLQATQPAGRYAVRWDGRDARGIAVPAGTYFARLTTDGASTRATLIVTR